MSDVVQLRPGQDNPLALWEKAKKALEEARRTDELLKVLDYARQLKFSAELAKDREAEAAAAEIRRRAERRVGELMAAQRDAVGLAPGGGSAYSPEGHRVKQKPGENAPPTLAEAGISKNLAHRARTLARLPGKAFEKILDRCRYATESEFMDQMIEAVNAATAPKPDLAVAGKTKSVEKLQKRTPAEIRRDESFAHARHLTYQMMARLLDIEILISEAGSPRDFVDLAEWHSRCWWAPGQSRDTEGNWRAPDDDALDHAEEVVRWLTKFIELARKQREKHRR